MNIDLKEARKLICLAVKNNPSGIIYPHLDQLFIFKMPDMIIGGYGNKLMSLLNEMAEERIIIDNNGHYTKGPNFPDKLD